MKLEIHPAATLEYRQSIMWYEEAQEGLGHRFEEAVVARLSAILENPAQGTKRWQSYREILVDNTFPFLIVFRLIEAEQILFVSAIFHTKRNPRGKYRKRA